MSKARKALSILVLFVIVLSCTTVFPQEESIQAYVEDMPSSVQNSSTDSARGVISTNDENVVSVESQSVVVDKKLYEGETIYKRPYDTIYFGCEGEGYSDITLLYA
ncbi:MAG: hypothetical protein GX800_06845, partial [Clostridiaceae bacterium]|nr:hypothetical protein [Clostridiaceae bacterium]